MIRQYIRETENFQAGKREICEIDVRVPFEKVNARGKEKDRALSLTKKEGALSLTREEVS